jgi:hypothetical protein
MTDRELLRELIDFLDRLDLVVACKPEWYATPHEFVAARKRKVTQAQEHWARIKKARPNG